MIKGVSGSLLAIDSVPVYDVSDVGAKVTDSAAVPRAGTSRDTADGVNAIWSVAIGCTLSDSLPLLWTAIVIVFCNPMKSGPKSSRSRAPA